jgi:prephenate dehydratase
VEFEGKTMDQAKEVLEKLHSETHFLKILGFYKKDQLE